MFLTGVQELSDQTLCGDDDVPVRMPSGVDTVAICHACVNAEHLKCDLCVYVCGVVHFIFNFDSF